METGYISVEVEQLQLALAQRIGENYTVRVDVEIVNSSDVFQWASTGDHKYSTSAFTPLLEEADVSEASGDGVDEKEGDKPNKSVYPYIHGFSSTFLRSTYIDLSPEVLNGIANASLSFKVMSVNNAPVDAPPPKKGQPPPEVKPAEEALFSLTLPLTTLLKASNCFISLYESFDDVMKKGPEFGSVYTDANVHGNCSSLSLKIAADNDLAEYVIGSKVFRWSGARLIAPPASWGLHAPDVVDPKAKVQPTAEEQREKYFENIAKLVADHSGVATYSLRIGGAEKSAASADADGTDEAGEGEAADIADQGDVNANTAEIQRTFAALELSHGKVQFDLEVARQLGVEDDVRAVGSLWTVSWESSSVIFLHRATVRKLVKILQQDPHSAYLPIMVKKTPSATSMEVEGGELSGTAYLELASIVEPGKGSLEIRAAWQGDDMVTEGGGKASLTCTASISPSLVPAAAVDALAKQKAAGQGPHIPEGVLSDQLVSSADPNRDIVSELRKEISSTIERIAQEYVSLFPEPLPPVPKGHVATGDGADAGNASSNASAAGDPASRGGGSAKSGGAGSRGGGGDSRGGSVAPPATKEDRQADFMDFLANNGIFHELKENLKPRVQLLIRAQYGVRGRALNKTGVMNTVDLGSTTGGDGGDDAAGVGHDVTNSSIETILSDLYVFLLKECSLVLNSLFTDTIIDRDASEFQKAAHIDDEEETQLQLIAKLLRQAEDATANSAYRIADKLLLERIQIINHTSALGAHPEIVHAAYAQYGRFLLQQCAALLSSAAQTPLALIDQAQALQGKAREALKAAYDAKPDAWDVALLYANTLIEGDQEEQGEYVMHELMRTQLATSKPDAGYDLESFNEFDGYESDRLCPIEPDCYAVLAALFAAQGYPLKARKALLMANRSFQEGNFQPDVSSHGSPRRTIVLVLARTCVYLFRHSFVKLGHACLQLALSSERAVTQKATARGKPAMTVPHIRCLLKQAQALASMFDKNNSPAARAAMLGDCGDGGGSASGVGAATTAVTAADAPSADDAERIAQAVALAQDGQMVADAPQDSVNAYVTLAQALQFAAAEQWQVIDAYLNAIQMSQKLSVEQVKAEKIVPLEAFVKAGKLLLLAGRYTETLTMLLYGCQCYSSSTLFMLLGVCCLRLDDLEDAEAALVEANLLDNRSAEVWAYLSLLCVSAGPHRLVEAERSLQQALRLGMHNSMLLRELATSFMSVDKLQLAEDLIRRAISVEAAVGSAVSEPVTEAGGGAGRSRANARTRKLLADILAGQNQAAKAVEEYQAVLADDTLDVQTKLEVADKCAGLLTTLGREEELAVLKNIIAQLQSEQQQQQVESSASPASTSPRAVVAGNGGAASLGSAPVMM